MRYSLVLVVILLCFSIFGCSDSQLTPVDDSGNNGGNTGSDVIWEGNSQSGWTTNNVEIDGNDVILAGDGISSLQSEPIDVSDYHTATLYYGIEFTGETSLKSCSIETSGWGVSDIGGTSWVLLEEGQTSANSNIANAQRTVYSSSWRINNQAFDQIRIQVFGINEGQGIKILNPYIKGS